MVKIKKGMLLTLGLMLIALELLAFFALMNTKNLDSNDFFIEMYEYNELNTFFSVIEKNSQEIFDLSGMVVNVNQNNVIINSQVPNSNLNYYENEINSYYDFVETNFEYEFGRNNVTHLILEPSSVTSYVRGDNLFIINTNNTKIEFEIEDNITSCNWNTQPGEIKIEVDIKGQSGSCVETKFVDSEYLNNLNINSGDFIIYINESIRVKNNINPINVTATINKNDQKIALGANLTYLALNYNEAITILK